MAKFEWKIGDVLVTVETPDGVPVAGATVDVAPESEEQFHAAAIAVGGLEELMMPTTDQPFSQNAYAWAKDEEGEQDYAASVNIREPPRERTREDARPPHPFFTPLIEEKADRERVAGEAERRVAGDAL